MNIFVDTNVVLEQLCGRQHSEDVENFIFTAMAKGDTLYISAGLCIQ